MQIEQLFIQNFRNIDSSTFYPHSGINFLLGFNAQGKTSFLEAMSYLSNLRSFRQAKSNDVIQIGKTSAKLSCKLGFTDAQGDWDSLLAVDFQYRDLEKQKASKSAFINGKRVKSSTDYLTRRFQDVQQGFHSIIFNPSDHELVRGEPRLRRSFSRSGDFGRRSKIFGFLQTLSEICGKSKPAFKVGIETRSNFGTFSGLSKALDGSRDRFDAEAPSLVKETRFGNQSDPSGDRARSKKPKDCEPIVHGWKKASQSQDSPIFLDKKTSPR